MLKDLKIKDSDKLSKSITLFKPQIAYNTIDNN